VVLNPRTRDKSPLIYSIDVERAPHAVKKGKFFHQILADGNRRTPVYFLVKGFVRMLLRLLATVKIEGLENVPPQGGFIMTPNHLSQIDPPLMLAALPRRIRVLAAQKYRRNPILLFLFEGMGCIWVRQFEADHEALRACLRFLRSGGVLGVSPEGTRSRITHALIRGRGGAAFLASRSGVKILPAAVWGTDTFFHDVLHFRRPKVFVRFGKPYLLDFSTHAKGPELENATDDIMCAIAAVLPPSYRGEYSRHPKLAAWLKREAG
jgi:1-acyl-sn-glycerol-3-phosphate acyltransferase